MRLYDYWRSTSSYRLRIALALKGVEPERTAIHLVRGEQRADAYRSLNPQGRVPSLELDDGSVLSQSLAIIEYLEEVVPKPALLPSDPASRARVRAVAQIICCDVHPLHNVSVLNYLRAELNQDEPTVSAWIARWIGEGLKAVEESIEGPSYCFGSVPGLAEVCLVPQVYAARRFGVSLAALPKIAGIVSHAEMHPAFALAEPSRQPDAG